MGDDLKLTKDKRHKSSSSLTGLLDSKRSERKLDIRASIQEVDDQFALAESRCDDLQEKLDLVKSLKKKRKLKKRSTTRVTEQLQENVPFISVRTQLKKKVPVQGSRQLRMDMPANPTRSYLDPATVEQHRMIHGYNQYRQPQLEEKTIRRTKHSHADLTQAAQQQKPTRLRRVRRNEGGDVPRGVAATMPSGDDIGYNRSGDDEYDERYDNKLNKKPSKHRIPRRTPQAPRRRQGVYERDSEMSNDQGSEATISKAPQYTAPRNITGHRRSRPTFNSQEKIQERSPSGKMEDRPVVELFNSARTPRADRPHSHEVNLEANWHPIREQNYDQTAREDLHLNKVRDQESFTAANRKDKMVRNPHRVRYRSRRYELPTVASQMKQAEARTYHGSGVNHSNIPFIVSKSTAPSHNIGVNIQQVLNGVKIQQPVSGIPFTIAYHMGLGYVPNASSKNAGVNPCLDAREMNTIRLGRKLLRLPSYKYISYNRLLNLYRESDGIVSRFLRSISRPHYFYTSMYNLSTREDYDGATSKGRSGSQEAKQSLTEYASLYREYEQVEKRLREGGDPDLERRRDELARELAAREEHIRKVVAECRGTGEAESGPQLRASASAAVDDNYRHSNLKQNPPDIR